MKSLSSVLVTGLWSSFVHFSFTTQEFDDPRDADDAVYELNGRELLGERYKMFEIVLTR